MNRSISLPRSTARPTGLVGVAALASLVAGAIHFAVVPEHLDEWPAAGIFFVVLGAFQAVWAVAYPRRARGWLAALGLIVNLATVALWTVSRTVGLPFAPEPWTPEAIGVLDVTASALEIVVVLALVAGADRLASRRSR